MKVARNTKRTVASLDVQSIRDISEKAFWDGLEILAVIELLEIGNQRRVQASVNKSGTRLAADIIKRALLVHLTFLLTRAYGGKEIRPGDRDARAVFEQLKKIPPLLTRCKTPPTSRRRSDYGINVGAIIAESVSSITGTNMSLTTGNLTRPHRHTGSCLVSREPPPQLSKNQRPGRASLTYPFARSSKLGQRRKIVGPPSAPVMGEIKNDPSTHPQTLVCLAPVRRVQR